MELSMGGNRMFLALVPNCMSLRTLIHSFWLTQSLSTNWKAPQWPCLGTVADASALEDNTVVCVLQVIPKMQTLTL